jgi:biopolymer transport protein ExbB
MNKLVKSLLVSVAVTFAVPSVFAQAPKTLDDLLDSVKKNRVSEARIDAQREAAFNSARADKQALLRQAQADLKAENDRGDRLRKQYADNDITLSEKAVELDNSLGTLGEMFGVVRQASSEAYGRISSSIISAEFPGRGEFLQAMSEETAGLPNIKQLEDLWFALQTEMTESGKVTKFQGDVVSLNGGSESQEVTRIGTFNLIGNEGYLAYNQDTGQIQPLGRQPESHQVQSAADFRSQTSGFQPVFIDPSQGAVLGLLTQRATMEERYRAGGLPGYIITGMFFFGVLIALYKLITLTIVGGKMNGQLKNTNNPSDKNPLGRVLKVYQDNKTADAENLELKLDEAILKELPSIERGVNIIKILAAIAPLLGLLGTVIGMIETFQIITLFGTADPRQMAGSISMALVTTAEGIIAALPLILLHSVVAGRAKSITHVLDEQTAGIIAAHVESESA